MLSLAQFLIIGAKNKLEKLRYIEQELYVKIFSGEENNKSVKFDLRWENKGKERKEETYISTNSKAIAKSQVLNNYFHFP